MSSIKNCEKWCISAYSQTVLKGIYTATELEKIFGGSVFHIAAKKLKYVIPKTSANRYAWAFESPPTQEQVSAMYDFYVRYTKPNEEIHERLNRIEEMLRIIMAEFEIEHS